MNGYRAIDVPVDGGDLRVGLWGAEDAAPAVLAIHGVTASHLAWQWLAEQTPGARLIAPDLRGRGRSSALPPPVGMERHVRDLVTVLDALGLEQVAVVGHSMGAFVALALAATHPQRIARVILVDGGLPLDLPAAASPADAVRRLLGPTAARLSMTFSSVDDYLTFWRAHPAFVRDWTPALERYFAYDLIGDTPRLRAATRLAVVEEDSLDQNGGDGMRHAQATLPAGTVLLAAERGLLDDEPPLYAGARRPGLAEEHPGLVIHALEGVNHYTIAMSERGARAIAAALSG